MSRFVAAIYDRFMEDAEKACRGEWRRGALQAVTRAAELLARHFPAGGSKPNQLPDQPLVL